MNFPDELLKDLPSTFYRVSVKALIFDDQQRLLVFCDDKGEWELPGGGWDYPETLEACLHRELDEEMKIQPSSIGAIAFTYFCETARQYHKLCLAVPVKIGKGSFTPSGDDLAEARYVSKEEFLQLPFQVSEAGVKDCVEQIWL